jgi:phosphatidylserine/phosphatidylglycerophosphate/cardiolipin synthase-like enzyme
MSYRFPVRTHNSFDLLVDSPNFWRRLFDDIANAKHTLLIEMYLVRSGLLMNTLIQHLINARERGVGVYLLFDDFGSWKLNKYDRSRLRSHGIEIAYFNPFRFFKLKRSLHRTHRKIIVIDHKIAYTGGVGFTDDFYHEQNEINYWHDLLIKIQGPCVRDWVDLFITNWEKWSDTKLSPIESPATIKNKNRGRVVVSQSVLRSEIRRSLLSNIRQARKRIWIATAYFVPSRKLRSALKQAAIRNVDVRVLVPGPITDNFAARYLARRFYGSLLRSNVRFYEYQPRFMHCKVFLCDDWISTGSSNLDRWNLTWNLDANQEITDPAFKTSIEQFFQTDFSDAREFLLEDWNNRSFKDRLMERFSGWIALFLTWFSRSRIEYDKS